MNSPERLMVVAFTSDWREHYPLDVWPQHMTVMPWMRVGQRELIGAVSHLSEGVGPLRARITGTDNFGPNRDIAVWTVGQSRQIMTLHQRLFNALVGTLEDATFAGEAYAPHITFNHFEAQHNVGDELSLPTLSVIGKIAGERQIVKNIAL